MNRIECNAMRFMIGAVRIFIFTYVQIQIRTRSILYSVPYPFRTLFRTRIRTRTLFRTRTVLYSYSVP